MKILSTTETRKHMAEIVNHVKYKNVVYGVGRHNKVDVIIIKFPSHYNSELNDITNINANSASFDFLADEEDIYSLADLKERYA